MFYKISPIFLVLFNISLYLTYLMQSSLYLLILCSCHGPPHSPLPTGSCLFALYTCESGKISLFFSETPALILKIKESIQYSSRRDFDSPGQYISLVVNARNYSKAARVELPSWKITISDFLQSVYCISVWLYCADCCMPPRVFLKGKFKVIRLPFQLCFWFWVIYFLSCNNTSISQMATVKNLYIYFLFSSSCKHSKAHTWFIYKLSHFYISKLNDDSFILLQPNFLNAY